MGFETAARSSADAAKHRIVAGVRVILRPLAWRGLAVGAMGLFGAAAVSGTVWPLVGSFAPEGRRGMAISLYGFVLFAGASLGPQLPSLAPSLAFTGVCLLLGVLLAAAAGLNPSHAKTRRHPWTMPLLGSLALRVIAW